MSTSSPGQCVLGGRPRTVVDEPVTHQAQLARPGVHEHHVVVVIHHRHAGGCERDNVLKHL